MYVCIYSDVCIYAFSSREVQVMLPRTLMPALQLQEVVVVVDEEEEEVI
jgi:hypothetical protein